MRAVSEVVAVVMVVVVVGGVGGSGAGVSVVRVEDDCEVVASVLG